MDARTYVFEARRTDIGREDYDLKVAGRMADVARLLHAAMGMTTETGEFMDTLKKYTMYGRVIDETNLREELGDLMWYVAIACHELNVSLEAVMERNIEKLRARYPEKFTEESALNRDLDAERRTLEKPSLPSFAEAWTRCVYLKPSLPRLLYVNEFDLDEYVSWLQARHKYDPEVYPDVVLVGDEMNPRFRNIPVHIDYKLDRGNVKGDWT